jgi:hypothetical protein
MKLNINKHLIALKSIIINMYRMLMYHIKKDTLIYKVKPRDGFLVKIIMGILYLFGLPLNMLHVRLKECFKFSPFIMKKIKWRIYDLDGLFIELWVLIWTLINILFLLPRIANNSFNFLFYFCIGLLVLRTSDLLYAFIGNNFLFNKPPKRSMARSYVMLFLIFIETAAIFSSIQIIISLVST